MKVLVKFNKNISTPKQVRTFKVFDLGVVTSTLNDLLNDSIIEIDDLTLPILKIKKDDVYNYYLINDLGKTNNFVNPYYTDDFTKDINLEDLISINTSFNDVITKHSELILDDGTNPHGTTKSDIGLNNVDNTSDLNKPISIATQNALNLKANINDLSPVAFSNDYNDLDNIPNNLQSLDDVLNIGNYSEKPATVGDFNAKSIQVGNDLIPEISGGLFRIQKNADGTINLVLDSVSHEDSDNFGRLTATLTNSGGIIFRHLNNENNEGVIIKFRKDGILFNLINSFFKVDKDGVARDVLLSGLAEITDIINLESTLNSKADLENGIVLQEQSQGSSLIMESSSYKIIYTNPRGEVYEIDLPIESLFRDANYNSETKKLILTLDSGDTIEVSLEDLVDLPEIQIENINPSVSPSDGKKVYFNINNGKIYLNYQNEWAFLGNAISDTEKSNINIAYTHSQLIGNPHNTKLSELSEVNTVISKTTPINNDNLLLQDSENSYIWKKLSWMNIKASLKTYFDSIYTTSSVVATQITTALVGYATQSFVNTGLATKQDKFFSHKLTTPTSYVTGTVSETEVYRLPLPPGSFNPVDVLKIPLMLIKKLGTNGTVQVRGKMSTLETMPTGTTDLIFQTPVATAGNQTLGIIKTFFIDNGNIKGTQFNGSSYTDNGAGAGAISEKAFDVTVTNYLYISVINGSASDQTRLEAFQLTNS